jgi:hypothetical protein
VGAVEKMNRSSLCMVGTRASPWARSGHLVGRARIGTGSLGCAFGKDREGMDGDAMRLPERNRNHCLPTDRSSNHFYGRAERSRENAKSIPFFFLFLIIYC